MSSEPTKDLVQLQETARALQSARTTRRALIRTGALAAGAGVLGLAPTSAPAAPGNSIPLDKLVLAQGLAPGTALVTSLRLPLPGIGVGQVAPLLQGDIANWYEVGTPIPLPVTLFAVDRYTPDGSTPSEVVADYDALIVRLDETPGGLAMLPIEMIDARVNTLEIDGVNPHLAAATAETPVIKIGVAGDIIFGRNGGNYQRRYGDYSFPMYQVKDLMSTFDVTVANFECFVSETIEPPELTDPNTLDFVTLPGSLQGLTMAGIDSVTMANNHAVYPYGVSAMNDTIMYLNEAGISPWGVGQDLDEARAPWVTEVNGVSIAFYGVDGVTANLDYPNAAGVLPLGDANVGATASRGGTNPLMMANIMVDIDRLAGEYDIVLPYIHAGEQYIWTPMDWVVDVSRQCVDAGATAVLTSHPHATMGMEIYNGKPIFYSIGNFVYDQMFSVETRQGYLLDLTFRGSDLVGFRIHGVEIMDFVQPRLMSAREHAGFMDRFWRSVDLTRRQQG